MFYFVIFLKCFYVHMWGSEMRSSLSQGWYVICHWLLRWSRVIPELFAWIPINKVILVSVSGRVFPSDTANVKSLCCMALQSYLTMLDGLYPLQLLESASYWTCCFFSQKWGFFVCFVFIWLLFDFVCFFFNRSLGSVLAVGRSMSVLVYFWTRI